MKKRARYLLCSAVLLAVEVCIALFVHDRWVRPYLGDVLAAVLLCCLARCIDPARPRLLALWVFLLSAAVEFSQLFGLADLLGLRSGVLRTLLGSTFDWADLLCYFLGCALFYGLERREKKAS